ncbi:MAG: serine hydrolase domain-containing protein [Vicinamibacteria bacterium]
MKDHGRRIGRRSKTFLTFALACILPGRESLAQPTHPASRRPVPTARKAAERTPPARFADPDRADKLARAFPEIDKAFLNFAQASGVPGVAWGIVIDGTLVHSGATGARDLESNAKAMPDSVFRIASMTKNFTAMAVMKLRDQGRLSLDAPVARYVPELQGLQYPTTDSPLVTIRHLLSHSAGLPEDNPWGDRQLAETDATLSRWMRTGFPFSRAPGMGYEYSNTGFAILGQVVARVSGMRARDYIDREILKPLGMSSTKWEASAVPGDRIARGYGRINGEWAAEKPLKDGAYGVMGGLYSSVPDLAKLVAFYLSAYPPRDDDDTGPIKRSTLREMQMPDSPYRSTALRSSVTAPMGLSSGGYAFGLAATQTCRFAHVVSHSGGLPGYGSQMRWLPEYGVGIVALANGTYAGPGRAVNEALEALARTGALNPRAPRPSADLLRAKAAVDGLLDRWSDAGLQEIAAMNLFLDRSLDRRRKDFEALRDTHGACRAETAIEAENALRGRWTLVCERGQVKVSVTLAPTLPPTVQHLETLSVLPPGARFTLVANALVNSINHGEPLAESMVSLSAPADVAAQLLASRAWGTCAAQGDLVSGGPDSGTLRLTCERGDLDVRLTVDAAGLMTGLRISPALGEVCVP